MKQITQSRIEELIVEGKALEYETRDGIRKRATELLEEGKKVSTFTLLDDWYYVEGIKWANAVGFVLIEDSCELVD